MLWKLLFASAAVLLLFSIKLGRHELARFPGEGCAAFHAWLAARPWKADMLSTALPAPADPAAALQLQTIGGDVLQWVGWPPGLQFATFREHTLQQVLTVPSLQAANALLVVLPGKGPPKRRAPSEPFFSVSPGSNVTAALPLGAINAVATAVEALRGGRRLHAFTMATAHLPLCASASGACAVWEAGSGRVVLHAGLAQRTTAAQGLPDLLARFVRALAGQLTPPAAATLQSMGISAGHAPFPNSTAVELGQLFARAGAAALAVGLASQLPLWWCIACPTILGLLAPFIFNYGLAAAAEQVCAALELPAEECVDLWWGAFALAMVLSLASAVPIVYLCRLPECSMRRVHGALAAYA